MVTDTDGASVFFRKLEGGNTKKLAVNGYLNVVIVGSREQRGRGAHRYSYVVLLTKLKLKSLGVVNTNLKLAVIRVKSNGKFSEVRLNVRVGEYYQRGISVGAGFIIDVFIKHESCADNVITPKKYSV